MMWKEASHLCSYLSLPASHVCHRRLTPTYAPLQRLWEGRMSYIGSAVPSTHNHILGDRNLTSSHFLRGYRAQHLISSLTWPFPSQSHSLLAILPVIFADTPSDAVRGTHFYPKLACSLFPLPHIQLKASYIHLHTPLLLWMEASQI